MIHEADGQSLPRAIADNEVVLVDFWAEWCAPCRVMAPMIERVAGAFPKVHVVKVDAGKHDAVLAAYDVKSLPTVQIYRGGKRVEQLQGRLLYPSIERALRSVT